MKPAKASSAATRSNPEVDAFMAKLTHPCKAEIAAVRGIILEVSPDISEEIKWNSPGFRTTESFATVNLRSIDQLQFIFHLGAKVRKPPPEIKIADPSGLVKWLGKDRCTVTLGAGKEFQANQPAFQSIVREWIKYV